MSRNFAILKTTMVLHLIHPKRVKDFYYPLTNFSFFMTFFLKRKITGPSSLVFFFFLRENQSRTNIIHCVHGCPPRVNYEKDRKPFDGFVIKFVLIFENNKTTIRVIWLKKKHLKTKSSRRDACNGKSNSKYFSYKILKSKITKHIVRK